MIKYPLTCLTNGSKLSWLMRTQELLRKEHNIMGKWYREGIILSRYQKLRAGVQINFPYYAGKLSKEDWIRNAGMMAIGALAYIILGQLGLMG